MAEFALGLTKTAVEGTLSRVKSAIEEEAAVKERVQEDLEFITGEFQMMQSFLRGANAAERAAKNQVVRTWVKQLRDLAFDVEDCVDFVLGLESPPWTNCLWRALPSCCKAGAPPLPMDEAVDQIKRLRTRVQDVSQRNARYNLLMDSPTMMLPAPTTTPASSSSSSSSSIFHILSEVWQAAGKLHNTGTSLKDLITSAAGSELQVVSLWPGSHGAAAAADLHLSEVSCLIREAYNDPEICSEFECRAWVKLTTMPHPSATAAAFNKQEFLNSLISEFCPLGISTGQSASSELLRRFNMKRYLLVIQGVSTAVEWDAIKVYLPDNNNGSRIIVCTEQLRTALLCTGVTYKVAELTRFADGQSLCAFSKVSVLRRDIGEFIWQIRRGGVISLLGFCYRIRQLYKFIMYKHKDLDGVLVFKEQSWVDVPEPFDLEVFCLRLFLGFQSGCFQAKEIAAVGLEGVAKRCLKYLVQGDCLVVINGLKSKDHWDMIKEKFLLSAEPMGKDTTIVVITNEASVAAHCADQQNQCLAAEDVTHDNGAVCRFTLGFPCVNGGKEYSLRGRLLFHMEDEQYHWARGFKLLGRENEVSALEGQIKKPGVTSLWGHPGVGKSAIVRQVYFREMYKDESSTSFSWVDMPDRPFDLIDFSLHLLIGFHSCDVEAQERAGIELLRGGDNPIEECCGILRQQKFLVVIDGLRSARDWDKIKAYFFSEPATLQGCIVVITNKERVAKHCVVDDRVLHVKRLRPLRRPRTTASPGSKYVRKKETFGWDAEFKLVGRDREIDNIIDTIYDEHGVFSLWGVAGVGKSALARTVYEDCIRKDTSLKHSWVDLPNPFDMSEFSQRLLLGFHSDDLQAKEFAAVSIMEGHDTVHMSCKIMRENACFLVIDGLRSAHDWDLIRAAFLSDTNSRRQSVIVVTNEASIAMYCVQDKSNVLNVKSLNATNALRFFNKIAWCGKEQLTLDEMKFSEFLVARCGGLPEVIASLGEYSAERIDRMGINNQTLRSISWQIHRDFMGKLETDSKFQSLRGLFCWMQSYFDACPDSLKPCIFYLSVFLAGQNIRRRRLLSRWIAEGYATETSVGVTAEVNGEILLAELIKSSIIQQRQPTPSNMKEKIVIQVNGFYHGYIISRPIEDNLVFALQGRCSINSQRVGQHLTIRSSWDRDKLVYQSIDFTRLRSLTVFGVWMPFFISTDMTLLRVLDLEDTTSGVTDDDLEQIGKILPRLKFLSLRGCKEITRVPDSFGALRQLQTLDVRNTKIVTLPRAIMKLVKLQYIYAGTTPDKLDEVVLAALASGGGGDDDDDDDNDDCTSTSSEDSSASKDSSTSVDSSASIDGYDRKIADVETPQQVDDDGLTNCQRLPAALDNGDCTSTRGPSTAGSDDTIKGEEAPTTGGGTSTSFLGIIADNGATSIDKQAAGDGDDTWHPTTKAYNAGKREPAPADCLVINTSRITSADHDMSKIQLHVATDDDDGMITSQLSIQNNGNDDNTSQSAATTSSSSCGVDNSQSRASAKNGDGTSTRQPETSAQATWRSKAQHVVVSCSRRWLSKKKKSHNKNRNGGGVVIPAAALGKLTALHTLGVINVTGARGKAVLKEISKLTQLHKLRVSGISQKNWQDLCRAILHLGHLVSFYVRLNKDEDAESFFCSSDDMFSSLPRSLKSLKLYTEDGHETAQVPILLIKQLRNLRKVNFVLKISTQEDIDTLIEMPNGHLFGRQYVKPTQAGELRYGWWGDWRNISNRVVVLEIDCGSYNSAIVFGPHLPTHVRVLVVHCSSTESMLELSGLENLWYLKEVTLKGSYGEPVKQHLQQIVDEHCGEPVLNVEEESSRQSPEPEGPASNICACCHAYPSCCFPGIISTCK